MPPSLHLTPSGGLLTHQFLEALQQPAFNHPAAAPETFALPGQKAPTPAELERAIGTAWELLVERWDALERDLPKMDISALRARWILPLLGALGHDLEYQRADLILDEDERGLRFPISHLARAGGYPVHTVLPLEGGLDARRDGSAGGLKRLSPHDLLQRYLNLTRSAAWGLLCDGLRLRLLRDYHHTYTRGYVEFDLQGIFTTRDLSAFRALYRLCHASRFFPMQAAPAPAAPKKPPVKPVEEEEEAGEAEEAEEAPPLTPLDAFYQHALSTGVKVGEDLRKNVRSAIETLANGFLRATPGLLERLRGGESTRALYDDILHVIYRILFLLFAEQRGMLPGRGSLYMDEFSLTALRARAERPVGEDPHLDLWERLKVTFRMVEQGVPELGVFGYDGALLSSARTPLLTPLNGGSGDESFSPFPGEGGQGGWGIPAIANADLLLAVRALTTVERGGVLQRISYADLSVEEIGSVYESLLDYTPRIAERAELLAEEGEARREIAAGQFFLDPRGKERKTTGSYYTHPSLVNELIRTALLPVLEERLAAAVPSYDPEHPENLTPAQREAAAEALLDLKVVDPACGSGAFLIAADNVLGLRLAQIRSGDLYPREEAVRQARREVLARCIYAVDLNPMAVELCKVSLWINAAAAGQQLNFLDHHIQCGNSLVGLGPGLRVKLLDEFTLDFSELEIPPAAFDPLSLDDKAAARAVKARHQRELEGRRRQARQVSLWSVTPAAAPGAPRLAEISSLGLSNPGEAERRYSDWAAEARRQRSRFAADLWTAAFFWPLTEETAARCEPPTEELFRLAAEVDPRHIRESADPAVRAAAELAEQLAGQHRFFHWPLAFPEVFGPQGRGGFDVVLGNPPWERIKLQEKEFFALHAPDVAEAPNAAARRRAIEALQAERPGVWAAYQEALRASESLSRCLRACGRYPLTARGDINTYQVFAEHARGLVGEGGRAGIIVPSGIATDFTNKDFFASLVEQGALASLYDFENRRGIFPGVHRSYKFSLLTLRGPGGQPAPAEFAFFLLGVEDLADPERRFTLTAEDFARLNPNTRTCPIFRTRTDAALTRKLYEAAPVLENETTGENPWGVSFMTMFHMTNDSGLFKAQPDDTMVPLYEGKMVQAYDHRAASVVTNLSNLHRPGQPLASSLSNYLDPFYSPKPQFWIKTRDVIDRLPEHYYRKWMLGFKSVTSPTNERTFISVIIPFAGVGNSMPVFNLDIDNAPLNLCFYAGMNSFVFDFCIRNKVGGVNLNFYIIKQVPCPIIPQFTKECVQWITRSVLELTYTAWDLQAFADDVWKGSDSSLRNVIHHQWEDNARETGGGHRGAQRPEWAPEPGAIDGEAINDSFPFPPFKWDEERRARLRAELDGLYAHLYGLHRDELAYILDTFPILRRKDEAKYGEFRTKRMVLEAYDRLAGSEMIPPEARARSQVSVLGRPAGQPEGRPAGRLAQPEPQKPAQAPPPARQSKKRTGALSQAEPPAPAAAAPASSDYGLYRCAVCGKRVMGYDQAGHTRQAHGGKDPGYVKIG